MPRVGCPIENCPWESADLDGAFAAVIAQQLQMHDKAVHSQPAPATSVSVNKKNKLKIDPPRINIGASPEEWESFRRQWTMYKHGTLLEESQRATALFYCCSNELRQDILRDIQDDIATLPEEDLLADIKRLAVKEESVLVHRMRLGKMTQAPGTGIRTFLASLRGQAALCKFTAKCAVENCNHVFDYSKEMIKDNLIRGISDPEILSDLLGDPKSDRTLDEVVSFIAQKEQGKATRHAVGDSAGAISQKGPSKRNEDRPQGRTSNSNGEQISRCWACAGPSHGPKNDRGTRAKKCPAWTFTCAKCSIMGHYSKCCSKCSACGTWGHRDGSSKWCKRNQKPTPLPDTQRAFMSDDAGLFTDQLATINEQHHSQVVEHHVHRGTWINRPSKPHPTVMAELTPLPSDHAEFGNRVPTSDLRPKTIPMIADSGCQSSIIPLDTAFSMGYSKNDIMPVKLSMKGAISEDLGVEGGIILKVTVKDENGKSFS